MSAPDLTPEQQDALIYPGYNRSVTITTDASARLLPLIGQMRFVWNPTESGAPMLDPMRPLTLAAPWEAVADVLGATEDQAVIDGWLDLLPLLRLASLHGQIAPGAYRLRNIEMSDVLGQLAGYDNALTPEQAGFHADGRVLLTDPHIRLLRNLNWRWLYDDAAEEMIDEGLWPGPMVDAKRVYGDMSFIDLDMHAILGLPVERRNDRGHIELTETQMSELGALHLTMLAATQAFVENVSLNLAAPEVQDTLRRWAESSM